MAKSEKPESPEKSEKSEKTKEKAAKTATPQDQAVTKSAKADKSTSAKSKKEPAEKRAATKPKKASTAGPRRPMAEKTFFAKPFAPAKTWHLIDAKGLTLGRLSSYVAHLLMGKHRPDYTRFADTGDAVIVINAKDVVMTGKKWESKTYHVHTNYPGGIKTQYASNLRTENPAFIIEKAVYRMLPKGHVGRRWYSKLKVYAGAEHPHTAQKPTERKLPNLGMRG